MVRPPPPKTTTDASAVPTWLKRQDRWGLWKPVWRGRRWEKVPVLSTNKPEQWESFEAVYAKQQARPDYGIGFLLTGITDFTAFDLDHCLDAAGKPEPWAADLVTRLDTYTEVTVGGDGLRMFVHGRYASDWVNKDTVSLEVYSGNAGRFVTVTGDLWVGAPEEIMTVTDAVLADIAADYRQSVQGAEVGEAGEMPDLIDGVVIPAGLNPEAQRFLDSGECDEDRSSAVQWTARCLLEVGLTTAEVLSVLAENAFAMEVALDHRRQDEERALLYLWKHHVTKAQAKARPVASAEDFADLAEPVDEVKLRLQAEIRRLASMDPVVFASQAKAEARALGMPVTDLRRFVENERRRRLVKKRVSALVDYDSPLPHVDEDGFPRNHLENLKEVMRRLGVTCRYNVITKEEELLIPDKAFSLDNGANASYGWLESECSLFDFPTSKLQSFLTTIADENLFNPVITWVTSRPWDGVSRLKPFYDTIQTDPERTDLKEILIRRWMLSAIAAAFSVQGTQMRGVLVLQGDQSIGKTRWLLRLVPENLRLAKEGMVLNPANRDSISQACSYWLVELGELDATFRKADISALKAFVTNTQDVLRNPYARKNSKFARRTVFFGSVNPNDFLHDETGSTRFWVIPCISVDYQHDIDMQQVWAEYYELWQEGEQHWLTSEEEELLREGNEEFDAASPIAEMVLKGLDWSMDPQHWRWLTPTELLQEFGIDVPSRGQTIECGHAIKKRTKLKARKSNGVRLIKAPYRKGVVISEEQGQD
jgi:hypothetical protein